MMDVTEFWQAQAACDTRRMADVLMAHPPEAFMGASGGDCPLDAAGVLLFEGFQALRAGDSDRAERCADAGAAILQARGTETWFDLFKCKAIALYQRGEFAGALPFFEGLDEHGACDPETLTYYGNTLMHLGRTAEARPLYLHAAKYFPEGGAPLENFLLSLGSSVETGDEVFDALLKGTTWTGRLQEPPVREIPAVSLADTFGFPIFINCRDRLGCLRRLVTWLLDAGYHCIYLIDNASTYPPLLSYYESFAGDPRVTILRLERNYGYQALWSAGILRKLDIRSPYVYTDPDVLPVEDCPRGLVARLYQILCRYPQLDKVGPGLRTDDLPPAQQGARTYEAHFYHVPLEEAIWYAPLDTTFALYAPIRHYAAAQAVRTTGQLMVRHLPWYLDSAHLPEDEAYYVAHADASSTFAQGLQKA